MSVNKENNMGNMTKENAVQFFNDVKTDLHEPITLEFTTAGSICIGNKILLDERELTYPWFAKQQILHEIAHYLEPDDKMHGTQFHYSYANLVQCYLGNGSFLYEEHERGYQAGIDYILSNLPELSEGEIKDLYCKWCPREEECEDFTLEEKRACLACGGFADDFQAHNAKIKEMLEG